LVCVGWFESNRLCCEAVGDNGFELRAIRGGAGFECPSLPVEASCSLRLSLVFCCAPTRGRAGDGRCSSFVAKDRRGARFRDFGPCSGRRDVSDRLANARRRCAPTRGRTGPYWGQIALERLLSPREVAELMPIGYHAILRAIRAGELRASRLRGHYAIRPSDLESWVESNVALPFRTSERTVPTPRRAARGVESFRDKTKRGEHA